MIITQDIKRVREIIKRQKLRGKTIGFVPTMGAFHQGHLSLIKKAKEMTHFVVVSIYVNPIQFDDKKDLEKYPRNLKTDLQEAMNLGVDLVFTPTDDEMYKEGFSTYVEVEGNISTTLCGKHRKGHFRGVTTICLKLFNIIQPDYVFFGEKDYQQLQIIKKMIAELNLDIKLISCPTIREEDGLACSSRNTLLTKEEREKATSLYQALQEGKKLIQLGERDSKKIINYIKSILKENFDKIDYVQIVDPVTLEDIRKIDREVVIAAAVKISTVRLIDNIKVEL